MIKFIYCIRKHDRLSTEEFERYWLDVHGPKVRSVAKELKAKSYIQSHPRMPELNQAFVESRSLAPHYDGVTELWWETEADIEEALSTPEGQAAAAMLIEDERNFIDFSRSSIFMAQEYEIF